MNKSYLYLFVRFVVLIALQVLIIDHINLGGYINPPLYILFILLLPFETPGWFLLLSAFALGFSIDIFSNSVGLHTASCVFADYEAYLNPGIPDMGTQWFVFYTLFLTLLHQLAFGILESFYFAEAGIIFIRMIASSLFTLVLIVLIEYLFMSRKK